MKHKPLPGLRRTMNAILVGEDGDGLVGALEAEDVTVSHLDGVTDRPALEDAGIMDADLFLLTDARQATLVPIVRDLRPDVRIVCYTEDSLPEFVSGSEVLSMDPRLLGAEAVAEELVAD